MQPTAPPRPLIAFDAVCYSYHCFFYVIAVAYVGAAFSVRICYIYVYMRTKKNGLDLKNKKNPIIKDTLRLRSYSKLKHCQMCFYNYIILNN